MDAAAAYFTGGKGGTHKDGPAADGTIKVIDTPHAWPGHNQQRGTPVAHPCEVNQQTATPTLCVRTHSPVTQLPQLLRRTLGEIMAYLGTQREQPAGMPYVAYRNMDMSNLDLEIGFPVAHALPPLGNITAGEIPAGTVASTPHVGPYDKVETAYNDLRAFAKSRGWEPTGVVYEFYFDGPEVPPEKTRTRIMFPVKPA